VFVIICNTNLNSLKERKTLDNNIHRVIREKNMTQGDLAQMVGVRREYLNRIINRKITPTVPLGIRIARALEVPVEELFILG
jgi:putative transcriptional regulator